MSNKVTEKRKEVTIRFAGDSGDGMQLTGMKFTSESTFAGNDVSTFPDYPSEIRAPAGTLPGVSGFQIHFASEEISTPGDEIDVLVAMNPAALKVALREPTELKPGAMIIANTDSFTKRNLKKVGYDENPLEDEKLNNKYQLIPIPISELNKEAVKEFISGREIDLTKNFFALGLVSWLFDRPLEPTIDWINSKFARRKEMVNANTATLKAGYYYGETSELLPIQYIVPRAPVKSGKYRKINGNEAIALGVIAGATLADQDNIFYGSYPITPASDILHFLAKYKTYGVKTFQAEDEIAAMASVVGAAFGGSLAITGTSGPGIALKSEAMGLAVMLELPCIIVNVQRGGPSTGLPTKVEQSDLLQAMFGRNGESPIPILAAATASDCFNIAIEAMRIAVHYMTPIIVLTDGYLANTSEPWLIPDISTYPKITIEHPKKEDYEGRDFYPYERDEKLSRKWVIPGTKDLQHRVGGLEKDFKTGNVSYDPENHQKMVKLRTDKVEQILNEPNIEHYRFKGENSGDILLVSWGSTYGAVHTAFKELQSEGKKVSLLHLRLINPMNPKIGEICKNFRIIVIPEMNMGQLKQVLESKFLIKAIGFNKVKGRPFLVSEIVDKINEELKSLEVA